jgi:Asp/Glu/hydantoin racemase
VPATSHQAEQQTVSGVGQYHPDMRMAAAEVLTQVSPSRAHVGAPAVALACTQDRSPGDDEIRGRAQTRCMGAAEDAG